MPEYKTSLVTRSFMTAVRAGEVYCPKKESIKLAYCPDPPTQDTVRNELIRILRGGVQEMNNEAAKPYLSLATMLS